MTYTVFMRYRGFTLVEIIIVISIIGILATIVTMSVLSIRQHGRNAERSTDISLILNAIYQYALDNNNQLPATITTATTTICRTGAATCIGLIDLSVLTLNQKYIPTLPTDPLSTSTTSTGYSLLKNSIGRVTILAPSAEASTTISFTR